MNIENFSPSSLSEQELKEVPLSDQINAAVLFIDQLPYLDDLDKYWARKDAEKLLQEGAALEDLYEKYRFYDHLAELQEQINQNIPDSKKREEVRNIIRRITSKPTHGEGRQMKLEHVLKIKKTVDAFRKNQVNLQFLVRERLASGDVHFGVAKVLNENIFEEVKKIFSERFWKLADEMHPNDFPHFAVAFNFALKQTFTQEKSLEEAKAFATHLKEAALEDVTELTNEFFSEKEQKAWKQKIEKTDEKKPRKILSALLDVRKEREKNEDQAKESLRHIRNVTLSKNPKAALSEIEDLREKFGSHIIEALRAKSFLIRLETVVDRIKKIEEQLEKESNQERKKQLIQQLEKIQSPEQMQEILEGQKKSESERRSEEKKLLQEIVHFQKNAEWDRAEESAWELRRYNPEKSKQKIHDIQKQKSSSAGGEVNVLNLSESSESKETKIEFLERVIEHTKSVLEECSELGIPKDDPSFWGLEGVRHRVAWLKKNGLWNTYKRFNEADRNMPHKTYAEGFRFRWLDVRTGNNLTYSRAEQGIRYLDRLEESGYPIATLSGAFSMDWKGASSPVYPPERFISLVQEELSRVRGASSSQKEVPFD